MKVTIKDWGLGLNKDQSPWELAPGVWSDGQNVRFRTGEAERMGGIATVITPSITPTYLQAYSSGVTRYAAYAGTTKAYVHDGSTETEITRKGVPAGKVVTAGAIAGAVTNPHKLTTSTAHGLTVGAVITAVDFTPADYNGVNMVVGEVLSTTTFSYTSATVGVGAATVIGSYVVVSEPTSTTSNFTGSQDDKWTGGNFNGTLILNNPVDGLYYYDQTITAKLHKFPQIESDTFYFARPFKNFIVHGGQTTGGATYRHRFGWSDAAEPGSVPVYWVSSDTNLAGNVDIVSDGEIVDAWPWGEDLIAFKRDVRWLCRYIGGNDVFAFQLISGNNKDDGLLAAGCVINTPQGQVFVTDGLDIRIHAGGESKSIAYGRMLNYFRGAIDATYRKRMFLTVNPYTNEVWVCFPESGQTTCTKAMVWNWDDDTWGLRDLPNVTSGVAGELPTTIATSPRLIVANSTPKIGLVDSGTTDFGASYQTMLERTGMDMDSTDFKTLHQSMPRFKASTNFTASIYHGSSKTQNGTTTYAAAQTYTHNTTERVNAFANSGRYLAYKITMTVSDTPALRSIDFWLNADGEF